MTWIAAVLVAVRAVWLVDYLRRCAGAAAGSPWARIVGCGRKAGSLTTTGLVGAAPAQHQRSIALSERQLDTSLVGGSVALAAWTQLFVSSGGAPGSRISGTSLALLFTGALVLVMAPVVFRTPGLHLTYIGRESGSHVGFGLVLLSLFSVVADLVPGLRVPMIVLACLIVTRDAAEVVQHLRLQKGYTY
ncbi:hypothetical protein ACFQV2_16070 [Actinokineospora soli]|uniref:Uncharacterized protein n=1 Tax=Actinokineospora soli TaxID=1048753 RepID=A0ABW2TQI7_9PSEU